MAHYYVYGVNDFGSTWYLDHKDASMCTLWSGAPKEMRVVYNSREEAQNKADALNEAYKFGSTRHFIAKAS
jgi:hypothetical protein